MDKIINLSLDEALDVGCARPSSYIEPEIPIPPSDPLNDLILRCRQDSNLLENIFFRPISTLKICQKIRKAASEQILACRQVMNALSQTG